MLQAKTHLIELIRQVQKGQEICLTNPNKEVAVIISVENYAREKKSALLKELQDLIKRTPLGTIDLAKRMNASLASRQ
jgi:prevent-host-death family protein